MQDEQYIIDTLGISEWPDDKRQPVVTEATMRVGVAMMDGLNEQQLAEYKAIVDDDQGVIANWLESNIPDYKNNPVYQEIAAGYDIDPEKNSPAKLFSTIAWVQMNVPDLEERINRTISAYKQELFPQ